MRMNNHHITQHQPKYILHLVKDAYPKVGHLRNLPNKQKFGY